MNEIPYENILLYIINVGITKYLVNSFGVISVFYVIYNTPGTF